MWRFGGFVFIGWTSDGRRFMVDTVSVTFVFLSRSCLQFLRNQVYMSVNLVYLLKGTFLWFFHQSDQWKLWFLTKAGGLKTIDGFLLWRLHVISLRNTASDGGFPQNTPSWFSWRSGRSVQGRVAHRRTCRPGWKAFVKSREGRKTLSPQSAGIFHQWNIMSTKLRRNLSSCLPDAS